MQTFLQFLTEDVVFRFGNSPAVTGKHNVGQAVSALLDSIAKVEHDVRETWSSAGAVFCHGTVTYTRHAGSRISLPFANLFKTHGPAIREYLIFADISEL